MKKLSDIILVKGKQKKRVYLRDITLGDIRAIFFPYNTYEKYKYLGSTWNIFKLGTANHDIINEFIEFVDSEVKPKWCPRWFLRLLHLIGNDNSIIRIRNWTAHRLLRKLTKGVVIMDMKVKWADLRIYGSFTPKIQKKINEVQKIINEDLEPY